MFPLKYSPKLADRQAQAGPEARTNRLLKRRRTRNVNHVPTKERIQLLMQVPCHDTREVRPLSKRTIQASQPKDEDPLFRKGP